MPDSPENSGSEKLGALQVEALSDIEVAWESEIAERISAIDAGKVQGTPLESVLAEINKRFRW